MITLHAFSSMFPGGIGETKDMRVQWALEELGVPYEVRGWDHAAGECDTPAFRAISPFGQIPMIEDDALGQEGGKRAPALAETAAILIHLAETRGRLTPADAAGRAVVRQWCVAAMATVSPAVAGVAMFDAGMTGQDRAARDFWAGLVRRWFDGLEAHLQGRDWIAAEEFTVADIALAGVLREVRDMEFLPDYPAVAAYYDRCLARPAWRRTRELTAERMGVPLDAIA